MLVLIWRDVSKVPQRVWRGVAKLQVKVPVPVGQQYCADFSLVLGGCDEFFKIIKV